MMRGLTIATVGTVVVAADLPSTMPGFVVKNKWSDPKVINTAVPQLGDLHKSLTGLPDSCEVLVEVKYSSINNADRYANPPFPQVMGSDIAGTVVAVQDSCTRLVVGDNVWADIGAITGNGKENGAFAPIAVALEAQLGTMPQNLGFEEAGSLPKVSLTGYKALTRYGGAPFSAGSKVLVLGGSGGTGSAGIQLYKAFGAQEIITTTSGSNADYVTSLGATQVIDYHYDNWWEVLEPGSLDSIYDTHGGTGVGDYAMNLLKPGGHYVTLTGAMPKRTPSNKSASKFINSDDNLDNIDLLEALQSIIEADQLRMPLRKTYALNDIADAFAESKAGHVNGKLVIQMPNILEVSV